MNRLILMTICFAVAMITAKAQVIPHYGKTYEKGSGKLSGVAAFEHESHKAKRTFINEEAVEGKTCKHYRVESATALKGGGTNHADWEEWIYEPDRIWRQRTDDVKAGGYLVHRNIKTGEQPAHLFEIPKDFKGSYLPAGGMLEMFTGKAQDGGNTGAATFQNLAGTKESEEKAKSANDLMKELKEAEKASAGDDANHERVEN